MIIAMGSPLSPLLCEMFMTKMKEKMKKQDIILSFHGQEAGRNLRFGKSQQYPQKNHLCMYTRSTYIEYGWFNVQVETEINKYSFPF